MTVQESLPLYGVPAIFTHVDAFLMDLLDVMRQISLVIGSVAALFAEVALDLVVYVFHVLLQVAPGSRAQYTPMHATHNFVCSHTLLCCRPNYRVTIWWFYTRFC